MPATTISAVSTTPTDTLAETVSDTVPLRRSLLLRLVLPVPIAIIVAVVGSWLIVPKIIARNATNDAIMAAVPIANQFKLIRAYYTENVVGKALASGALTTSVDHKNNPKAIPVPATLMHDMSAVLANNDTTISLYSKYPFPNRAGRQLDQFQREALDFLEANPKEVFSRNEIRNGKQVVRVAVADTFGAQACV